MLHEKVNIPNESRTAAFWVFQFSVFTCIVNTINIPYNALIIAHEKMNAFAVISILQVILNFLAAYCLFLFETDRLLIYSAVLATASVLTRILYQIYCHRKFAETNYSFEIDVTMLRQIGKFAGVSTVSGGLQIIASQGLVFIINIVFGVAVNAVYSIALQLKNSVLSFALNVQRAISPQITKTYANGEMEIHKKLVYSGSKVEVFLIYLIMIPFLFKTREILALWLNDVPDHMVIFAQCLVFISLIHAAIGPIQTAVFATNKISKYLIIPDSFYLLVLPIGYFLGIYTKSPDILIYIVVIMSLLVCMMRLYYAHKVTSFSLVSITKGIIFPCILVAVLSILCCYILIDFLYNDLVGIILLYILNGIILFFAILCIGLTKNEQKTFFILIRKIRKNR